MQRPYRIMKKGGVAPYVLTRNGAFPRNSACAKDTGRVNDPPYMMAGYDPALRTMPEHDGGQDCVQRPSHARAESPPY